MAEAEQLYYRGMAAASLKANGRWRSSLDADLAPLDEVAPDTTTPSRWASPPGPSASPTSGESAPVPDAIVTPPVAEAAPDLGATGIVALAEALIALKQKKREWTAKTGSQMRQTAALLVKITGREALPQLRQADLARFSDTLLLEFPKNYGRSSRDAAKPIAALLAAARELPIALQSMFADLVERAWTGSLHDLAAKGGSSYAREVRGRRYWYWQSATEHGKRPSAQYLGPDTDKTRVRLQALPPRIAAALGANIPDDTGDAAAENDRSEETTMHPPPPPRREE